MYGWLLLAVLILPTAAAVMADHGTAPRIAPPPGSSRGVEPHDGGAGADAALPRTMGSPPSSAGEDGHGRDSGLLGFFLVGLAINLVVIALFARWFVGEWRRNRRSGDRGP